MKPHILITLLQNYRCRIFSHVQVIICRINARRCECTAYDACLFFICRATLHDNDVWNNLQRNWNHFFLLTGETPHSLQILVDVLDRTYFWHRHYGRNSCLDLKNQVKII